MNSLRWIDRVGRRLIDQGLPKSYIRRVVGELRDHHSELAEQEGDEPAVIRLGNPSRLAGAIAGNFRRQHFSGRHPALAFLVAPVLLMIGLWAMFPLSLVAAGAAAEAGGVKLSDWFGAGHDRAQAAVRAYSTAFAFGVPALVALVVCRWAQKSAVAKTWLWISCALMALLAFAYQVNIDFPTTLGKGRLAIGFGLTAGTLRLAIPVMVTLATVRWLVPRWEDEARETVEKPKRRAA